MLLVVVACGGNQPVPARLKGVSLTSADALSTAFPSDRSRLPACIVRYDFGGSAPALPAVECATTLVGGDPLHWITTCPSHPFVHPEVEVQVDAQRVPLFERLVTSAGEFTFSYGPLQSRPGVTVTQTDAAGNPLQAVFAVADLLDGSGARSSARATSNGAGCTMATSASRASRRSSRISGRASSRCTSPMTTPRCGSSMPPRSTTLA